MIMKMMICMLKRYLYLVYYLMFVLINNYGKFKKWKWDKVFFVKVFIIIIMCNICKIN